MKINIMKSGDRMIEIRLLEQILAFEKHQTLIQTAKALHISQPALSRSFRQLEESLNIPIFDRSAHNQISLNENGKLIAEYASRILKLEEEMERELEKNAENLESLRILSSAPAPLWNLERMLKNQKPDIHIESSIENSDTQILNRLRRHETDLVLTHNPLPFDPDLKQIRWMKEELLLSVPKNHPLSQKRILHLEDIANQNIVLFENIGFWNQWVRKNLPDCHILRASEWNAFAHAVLTGAFPYFSSSLFEVGSEENVVRIPFDPPVCSYYYAVFEKRRSRQMEQILDLMAEHADEYGFFTGPESCAENKTSDH